MWRFFKKDGISAWSSLQTVQSNKTLIRSIRAIFSGCHGLAQRLSRTTLRGIIRWVASATYKPMKNITERTEVEPLVERPRAQMPRTAACSAELPAGALLMALRPWIPTCSTTAPDCNQGLRGRNRWACTEATAQRPDPILCTTQHTTTRACLTSLGSPGGNPQKRRFRKRRLSYQ